jgi:hypothetical protein
LFSSLRHKFDPLDLEILQRTFDAALATIKGDDSPVEFDSNKNLEALLRRELIQIACVTGVSEPERLQDLLLARIPTIASVPKA